VRSVSPPALIATLAVVCVSLSACPPPEAAPCFPTATAVPTSASEGGFDRTTLAWEIDKLPALVDAPPTDPPPSPVFIDAQRDMRTEFWPEAAKALLAVVRGDTNDGKLVRQHAEYDLAIALFRLRYFEEAKRIFKLIADEKHHPRRSDAQGWLDRRTCDG
jgi:hypothetical protein